MTKTEYAPMDIPSLLDSEETIREYLLAAEEDGFPGLVELAQRNVAEARRRADAGEMVIRGAGHDG